VIIKRAYLGEQRKEMEGKTALINFDLNKKNVNKLNNNGRIQSNISSQRMNQIIHPNHFLL
jgi:hypothetical protein